MRALHVTSQGNLVQPSGSGYYICTWIAETTDGVVDMDVLVQLLVRLASLLAGRYRAKEIPTMTSRDLFYTDVKALSVLDIGRGGRGDVDQTNRVTDIVHR